MAYIKVEIPDGPHCTDCQFVHNFEVEEIDITTLGDKRERFLRTIVARCRLFRKEVRGSVLDNIIKCYQCKKAIEEENNVY